ncbi:MAG: YdcF family protein [Candidatus Paceibacterota bacterium]
MKEWIIVLGYGCVLTKDLKNYLQKVAEYVKENPFLYIITCGGFTERKSNPGVSEAGMMRKYLMELGIPSVKILEENRSQTTIENIYNVSEILDLFSEEYQDVVIFCDSTRKFKVKQEAKHFLNLRFKIYGVDFNRTLKEKIFQWFIATPLEMIIFRIPLLRDAFTTSRFKRNAER